MSTTAANWSKANNFRIDMLFNGGGSVAVRRPANGRRPDPARCAAVHSQTDPDDRQALHETTSDGSATRGITRTSTRAARPRTTSRPSSTEHHLGHRRPRAAAAWADLDHRPDRSPWAAENPSGGRDRRAFRAGEPAAGQPGQVDPPSLDSATVSTRRRHAGGRRRTSTRSPTSSHCGAGAEQSSAASISARSGHRPTGRWRSPGARSATRPTTRSTARSPAATPGRW